MLPLKVLNQSSLWAMRAVLFGIGLVIKVYPVFILTAGTQSKSQLPDQPVITVECWEI